MKGWGTTKPPRGAVIDCSHPLAVGLTGCWLFNNAGSGVIVDLAWNTRATLSGGTAWGAAGVGGPALRFDGTDDCVLLGSAVYLTTGVPFSISWWEWIPDTTGTFMSRMALQQSGDAKRFGIGRTDNGTYGNLLIGPGGGAGNVRASDAPTIASSVARWNHFVVTGSTAIGTSSSNYTAYCNGRALTLADCPAASIGTVNQLGYLGAASGFSGANCVLDGVRIYSRRLTPNEARTLYEAPWAGIYSRRRGLISGPAATAGRRLMTMGCGG